MVSLPWALSSTRPASGAFTQDCDVGDGDVEAGGGKVDDDNNFDFATMTIILNRWVMPILKLELECGEEFQLLLFALLAINWM